MLGINPGSVENRFQHCFYNQFNEKMPEHKFFKNLLKDHIPKMMSVEGS
jgi:hypothetical protein